jgi:hypothetical protein
VGGDAALEVADRRGRQLDWRATCLDQHVDVAGAPAPQ